MKQSVERRWDGLEPSRRAPNMNSKQELGLMKEDIRQRKKEAIEDMSGKR